jgi:predicted ATPase
MRDADNHPSVLRPEAPADVIGAHLDKILGSHLFAEAESLRSLLRFIVEETVAGRGGGLKEYVLGSVVLRKGEGFDPKADPIVRVQMRRLRERLERYYAIEGAADWLTIEIPKGSYVPTFRSNPPAVRAAAVAGRTRAVVGRDDELGALHQAFDAAAAGRGSLLCLSGEPGIGKTTIVDIFLREIAGSLSSSYVARGRCSERLAGTEAYLPLLEALDVLLRDGGDAVRGIMSSVAPDWFAEIARASESQVSNTSSQDRLKRELAALVEALARQRPVVLFIDDVQWADASTVDMIGYVGARCGSQRVLVVTTYRPSELTRQPHPFVGVKLELQGRGLCRDMALPLLTCEHVADFLTLQFPGHQFPGELAAGIHARTDGNPLFMSDLARFLRDRGVLVDVGGQWRMIGRLPEIVDEFPESVRSIVEKKIGELGDVDRHLMSAAAVQGIEFDSAVLARALRMDVAEVEERLDRLDRIHGFVRFTADRELPDRTLTLRYAFVHVLYQNALYAALRPARRASLSGAMAEALLQHHAADPSAVASALAALFEAARDFDRATQYFLMAAQHAARLSAYTEAAVAARRGLAALAMLPADVERVQREFRLQTTLGPALMGTVGYGSPEVEAVYIRARELCPQVGDDPRLAPVVFGLYQSWLSRADYQTCQTLAEQLLGLGQRLQDSAVLLAAHTALGNTFCFSGKLEEARTHAEQAIDIYNAPEHHPLAALYSGFDLAVGCTGGLAVNLWLLGYPDQAVAKASAAIALARQLSHTYSILLALNWDAQLHQHRREPQHTLAQADAAIALAGREPTAWLAWAMVLRGWALATNGQGREGISQLREGLAGWERGGLACLQPYFLGLLAEAHVASGERDAALAILTEALAISERTGERYAWAELHRLSGTLQSDPGAAEESFRRAIAIAREQSAKSVELRATTSLGRLLVDQARGPEARRLLGGIVNWFSEGADTADAREARTLLAALAD